MEKITNLVRKGKILVSDGAWGTFLQQKGLGAGECPEHWNLTRPDDVLDVARSYIAAGADMIETNSFGGSIYKLMAYGLQSRAAEINRAAARISRNAAGDERHVLGSIGPTGKLIMMGDVTYDDLYAAFREQAIALEQGGADALIVETMSDLDEARAAASACKEGTNCELICTMTFQKTAGGGYHTMMGITPARMAEEMIRAGADIIGANCGNGIQDMIGIVREIRTVHNTIPVLVHPNAGVPVYKEGKTHFPESPMEMAGFVDELIDAGARIIGGCCGTTPEHIQCIADRLRAANLHA